ncbi:MAG: hypothetical protein ABSG88_22270 [Bradyrhizobium sp.]
MLRLGLLCLLVSGSIDAAMADSALERGDYLVNTILACGNCHTPRDANGAIIKDKALAGGRVFSTPAFVVTTSNITPDVETGIGNWTDAEIKRALIEGIRPDHHRLPGVPLAAIMPANFYKALLPEDLDAIIAYLRSVKPVRNEISDPVYKTPIHRDPYPDADKGFDKSMFGDPVGRGASRHHRPLHGMPLGLVARRLRLRRRAGPWRQGLYRSRPRGSNGRQHHLGSHGRHRRVDRSGDCPCDHAGPVPRRADSQAANGLCLLCRNERKRSRRHHCLPSNGSTAAIMMRTFEPPP